jgi:hypothetical protein
MAKRYGQQEGVMVTKPDAVWWLEKPMRMIQTNLREIDASLDVDQYVRRLKEFAANVILFNVGGIVANYPTALEYHYRNPHLKDDFVGKVIERVHAEDIRFMARFDFSKINERFAERHPEWLYKSVQGKHINYNGQVHTCINGYYQQVYALKILEEVIERYPIDAVFFNMIGYVTRDYSGNYHGICQCDSCQKRFGDYCGEALPHKEDGNDPVFRTYETFRRETVKEQFERIQATIKSKGEHVAICNYTHAGADILRKESNTGIDRPLPEWNFSASENVKTVLGSWDHVAVSNAAVHFVDFAMRHSAVSPNLTALRLAQNLIHGGWLDYYVIGTLDNQDDRLCFGGVKELFDFHRANERYYTGIQSLADVCLVVPSKSSMYGGINEFRGLFRILSQAHVPFDVIHDSVLDTPGALERLNAYRVVILPEFRNMSGMAAQALDRFVEQGGNLLATGASSTCDTYGHPLNRMQLSCLGIGGFDHQERRQGTYFRIKPEDKARLRGFEALDIVYLDGDFWDCRLESSCESYLGYIPAAMFGPPEKCYYTTETDKPGLVFNRYGAGKSVLIPWSIGKHYEKLSNHGHFMLVEAAFELLGYEKRLAVRAPQLVEVAWHRHKDDHWQLVSLVNLSGQLGTAFLPPIAIKAITVRVHAANKPERVFALKNQRDLPFEYTHDRVLSFEVPELSLFETVVVRY